jgi:hypothetical protein
LVRSSKVEAHVQLIINHVNDRMANPFDASSHPKALINISTGMHATREIQESLTGTVDEGMKMLQSFVNGYSFYALYHPRGKGKLESVLLETKGLFLLLCHHRT